MRTRRERERERERERKAENEVKPSKNVTTLSRQNGEDLPTDFLFFFSCFRTSGYFYEISINTVTAGSQFKSKLSSENLRF